MKRIKVVLGGGLGNQLFQYATYLYLSKSYPDIKIGLDMFQYKYDQYHNGIEYHKIFFCDNQDDIRKIECFRKKNKISKKYPSLLHVISNKVLGYKTFYDDSINTPIKLNKVLLKYNKCIFAGFYQNPYFVEEIESFLRARYKKEQNLGLKNENLLANIKNRTSVCLHIRRGDYVNISKYDVFNGLLYYDNAIKYFNELNSNIIFVVFSNDIDWVKNNLIINNDVIYVDWNNHEDSYKDMILMSKCTHNIIANSSFSWWGAWLNENIDKIVIAPRFWFKGVKSTNIVPSSWKIIDC